MSARSATPPRLTPPRSSAQAPGAAAAAARQQGRIREARHPREDSSYQVTRVLRLIWRHRWLTVPLALVLTCWTLTAAEVIREHTGGRPPTLTSWVTTVAVTVLGVGYVVTVRWLWPSAWKRRRARWIGLAWRHRFEDACRDLDIRAPHGRVMGRGGRAPVVKKQRRVPAHEKVPAVVVEDGTITSTVHLPRRLHDGDLVTNEGQLRPPLPGLLDLPAHLGFPEFIQVWPRNTNSPVWLNVRAEYRSAPGKLDWGFRPAPDDFSLRVGAGPRGENIVDLLASPHLRIYGPPRSGKGVLGMDLAAQGSMRGWLILLVNCSGAPEWNPWQVIGLPNVRVIRCSLRNPIPGAVAIARAMDNLLNVAERRDAVCTTHGAHAWAQLDPAVRLAHPRVLCIIDEPSALLKTAGKLGKEAGGMIEMVARTGPKYGITLGVLDQIINVTAGAISGPTLEVMRYVVWIGDQPDAATRNRIGGFVGWPSQPDGKGGAVTMNFGAPKSSGQQRLPYHSPADLDRFLAAERRLWP